MIKVSELRHGNIVDFDDGSTDRVRVRWVFQSGGIWFIEWVKLHGDGSFKTGNSLLEDFSPIPLTPEVLLACGFEWETDKKRHLQIWLDDAKTKSLGFYFSNGIIDQTQLYNYGSQDNFHFSPLKSLHQLQNIYFALTGEELPYQQLNP